MCGWHLEPDGVGSINIKDEQGTLVAWVRWPPDAGHIVGMCARVDAAVDEVRRLRTAIQEALDDYDHRDELSAIDRLRELAFESRPDSSRT